MFGPVESIELYWPLPAPGWRNWQTHQTQNLARGDSRGGSTPPSGTNEIKVLQQF